MDKKNTDGLNLPVEEVIMNLVYCKNEDKFQLDTFDTWYHENHTMFYKLDFHFHLKLELQRHPDLFLVELHQ